MKPNVSHHPSHAVRTVRRRLWIGALALAALAAIVTPAANAQSCGCYELRDLCGKVGGVPQAFASYGLYCVVDGQSADSVATWSYRMQDFPKDCEMFVKKLENNLGSRILERGLYCGAAKSCGCYNLPNLCGKVGGVVQSYASHGTFCVVDGQSADSVSTLSYRMQDFPKDCEMFNKKLGDNLGKRIVLLGLQ